MIGQTCQRLNNSPQCCQVFRLPVYPYQHRLGRFFGGRLLLLAPCGRKSGRVHETVLEVIGYGPNNQESIVVSAWGERTESIDWYRNIRLSPVNEIWSGWERYLPAQRFLAPEEDYAEIDAYERRHPWLAWWLGCPLDGTQVARRGYLSGEPFPDDYPESLVIAVLKSLGYSE